MDRRLPEEVRALLERCTTMVLATANADGSPAAAPLFYALAADDTLLFISEERTLHCRNLAARPAVALAVYGEARGWREIQGLQARGVAFPLPEASVPSAQATYLRRFPEIANAPELRAAMQKVRWYGIRLHWVRLIDNRRGFGWKAEWEWTENGWERVR